MSEFELITAFQGSYSLWVGTFTVFLSVLFAYLVTAYLVGGKLTSAQIMIITALYVVFSVFVLRSLYNVHRRMGQFAREIGELNPDWFIGLAHDPRPVLTSLLITAIPFFAFLAGLVFMFQIRRNSRRHD